MEVVSILLAVLFGFSVGSFLNVLIIRGERGESFRGRSYCESCKTVLSAKELIPVLSFIIQKGRCRNCGAALSWQYPIIELGTAIFYGFAAWYVLPSLNFDVRSLLLLIAVFSGIGATIVILVSDFRFEIIPNGAVIVLLLIGFASIAIRYASGEVIYRDVVTAIAFSAFFSLLWLISRGQWMGLGDGKLIFPTSLILGYPASLLAFLLSFWAGGIVGIFLIIAGKRSPQNHMPFGPFILLGGAIAYFFSEKILYLAGLTGIL